MLKKLSLSILGILLLITAGGCQKKDPKEEQAAFQTFMKQAYIDTMQQDVIKAHAMMLDPTAYELDIDMTKATFMYSFDSKTQKAAAVEAENAMEQLEEFDRSLLSDQQKAIYDSYHASLSTKIALYEENELHQVFTSVNGIHVQLQDMLKNFRVQDEADVQALIALTKDGKRVLEEAIAHARQQKENDTLLLDHERALADCAVVTAEIAENTLYKALTAKIDNTALSDKKKEAYTKELQEAFTKQLQPAYQAVEEMAEEYGDLHTDGLTSIEDSIDYYETLFFQQTGSTRSLTETSELLDKIIDTSKEAEIFLANKDVAVYEDWLDGRTQTGFTSYQAILQELEKYTKDKLPDLTLPSYKVVADSDSKSLHQARLASFPIDDTKNIQLYLYDELALKAPDTLPVYTALARYGFPGKLYQKLYNYEMLADNWSIFCAENPAFAEGFALYICADALDHLQDAEKRAVQLERKQIIMETAFLARADIGIHSEGWTKETFTQEAAIMNWDEETTSAYYAQIATSPGAFLSAGVGYMEIAQLYEQAEDTLDDDFNEKSFHEALLRHGNVPFSAIEESITAYCDSAA